MFTNNFDKESRILTIVFEGHIDTMACQAIDAPVNELINSHMSVTDADALPVKVEFDMREVTFIASSFIRLCVYYAKQLPKDNFKLVNCNPFVKKTFMIAGLESLMRNY